MLLSHESCKHYLLSVVQGSKVANKGNWNIVNAEFGKSLGIGVKAFLGVDALWI